MMAANIHLPFNNNGLTINWPQIQQTRTILIGKIQKMLYSLLHDIKTSLSLLKQCILFILILLAIDTWLYRYWKIVVVFFFLRLFFLFTYFLFSTFIFHHNVVLGCVKYHIFILMRSFIHLCLILSRELLFFILFHCSVICLAIIKRITPYLAIRTSLFYQIFGWIHSFNLQRHKLSIHPCTFLHHFHMRQIHV